MPRDYLPRDYFKEHLDKLREVLDYIEELSPKLTAEERREIAHPELFLGTPYKLYYRAPNRDSVAYKVLKKITGRDTELLYPQYKAWEDRWYDEDVDRELWGYGFTYLGREEYKYTWKLDKQFRFEFPESSRKYLSVTLAGSRLWIAGSLKNFSSTSSVDRGHRDGKGVVLYKFYTADFQYFSIINFTGANLESINTRDLALVGARIQPWASELMNFLVEAWVRRKYEDAIRHITNGLKSKEFKFTKEIDKSLLRNTTDLRKKIRRQFRIEAIMDDIMDIVHYDTILNDYGRYQNFVDGIKQGELSLECLNHAPKKRSLGIPVDWHSTRRI